MLIAAYCATRIEIISNLFVYAFVSNGTSAIVLSHNFATHPVTRDQMAEEFNPHMPSAYTSPWKFCAFPKLRRCLAVPNPSTFSEVSFLKAEGHSTKYPVLITCFTNSLRTTRKF